MLIKDEERFRKEIFGQKVYGEPVGGVVMDIGSHVGLFVEYEQPKASIIYAIEPSIDNYNEILRRVKEREWTNVKPYNLAIGGSNCVRKIYGGGSDGAWSFSKSWGEGAVSQDIEVMTLKTFMQKEGIEHIDILKVDCEGAEDEIIFTAEFADISDKIDKVVGELHGGHSASELCKYGYTLEDTGSNQIFRAERKRSGN